MPETQKCFVISPLGEEDSPARERADDVLEFIITPALKRCQYETPPIRADKLSNPGRITKQVIDYLMGADLVIADLSDHNPNVFYELAIRHAARKPVVQIIHKKDRLPFDVSNQRTIFYDHNSLRGAEKAIGEIVLQIEAVKENPDNVDSPLAEALVVDFLLHSVDPIAKSNADIMYALQDIRSQLLGLRDLLFHSVRGSSVDFDKERSDSADRSYQPVDYQKMFRMVDVSHLWGEGGKE